MREKLVATLAHDIRNPVSAAYLSVGMMNFEDGEERFNKIKGMSKKSLKKSLDLIEGLLDAITVQAGQGISLDFSRRNMVDDIKREYTEAKEIYSNEIILDCEKEVIEGVFDGTAIRRVIENLITNAVKYGSRETPITIAVEDRAEEVVFSVHNYGNSISEPEQKEIFHFMTKTEKPSPTELKSWGIGLSFVKMAAEAHKGRVKIHSHPETGTTFTIILRKDSNKPGKVRAKLNYNMRVVE